MPDPQPALGHDDYAALYQMMVSPDASQRTQAQQMAGKLTPAEAQSFFDFQHLAHGASPELHREDNSLLGLPPEAAVASGLGIGGAVMRAGVAGASKVAAAGKAAMGMATPIVKYEATRTVLEKVGVPAPLAVVAAMAVSGYKLGGKATASEATLPAAAEATAPAVAEAVSPVAAAPAPVAAPAASPPSPVPAPASAPPPVPPVSPPLPPPQPPVQRPVGPPKTVEAMKAYIVKSGLSPEVADALVAKLQAGKGNPERLIPSAPVEPPPAPAPARPVTAPPPKPLTMGQAEGKVWEAVARLPTAPERLALTDVKTAAQLVQQGMDPAEALAKTLTPTVADPAAALAARLGTKTDAEVAADMSARYQRGQKSLAPKASRP